MPLHDVAQPGLPCAQSGCEIKEGERLAGTPLARQQPMSNRRDEPLDQPGFHRPRVGIAVGIEPRQAGVLLRRLLVEIITVWTIVELWILGFILWRLIPLWRFLWLWRRLGRPAAVAA